MTFFLHHLQEGLYMNDKKLFLTSLLVLGMLVMGVGSVSVTDTEAITEDATAGGQNTATVCGLMTNSQASGNNPGKKCIEAFTATTGLCEPGETPVLQSCTVPQPPTACTNGAGRSGYECECSYTCKKNPVTHA